MITFREGQPLSTSQQHGLRTLSQQHGLRTLESSLTLDGKEHKFCMEIGFMVLGTLDYAYYGERADFRVVSAEFPDVLRAYELVGPVRRHAQRDVGHACNEYNDMHGSAPVELRFRIVGDDMQLKLYNAHAVDRSNRCRDVVVIVLRSNITRVPYIDKEIRNMLAHMVWATRVDPAWAVPEPTRAERMSKSRKVAEEAATTRRYVGTTTSYSANHWDKYEEEAGDVEEDDDEEEDSSSNFFDPGEDESHSE